MNIRQAEPHDVQQMVRIIAHYASQGLMLPRSVSSLTNAIQYYVVADSAGEVIGCGGLQQYTDDSAEIYGLATTPEGSPPGTGRAIVEALIRRARDESIQKVFALTLVPGFFAKLGFKNVEHRDLPLKVWKDCVACPKFGNCDEIAMLLDLN
jgi:amino-acid N-acetyltransferase